MDLYIWRLVRIGFAFSRAYEVCIDYRKNKIWKGWIDTLQIWKTVGGASDVDKV